MSISPYPLKLERWNFVYVISGGNSHLWLIFNLIGSSRSKGSISSHFIFIMWFIRGIDCGSGGVGTGRVIREFPSSCWCDMTCLYARLSYITDNNKICRGIFFVSNYSALNQTFKCWLFWEVQAKHGVMPRNFSCYIDRDPHNFTVHCGLAAWVSRFDKFCFF